MGILSIGLSLIGLIVGEFAVEVESEGWWSRGTLQANREAQIMLVKAKSTALFYYENQSNSLLYDSVWDDLQMNNQAGYDILASGSDTPSYDEDEEEKNDSSSLVDTLSEEDEDEDEIELRRRTRKKGRFLSSSSIVQLLQDKQQQQQQDQDQQRRLGPNPNDNGSRSLSVIAGCDLSFYSQLPKKSLWPVWKIKENADTNN